MDQPEYNNAPQTSDQPSRHRCADLKAYLDGETSSLHRWWVSRHLEKCASCREELTVLKRLSKEMHDLERAVPHPQLRARILASLPEATPGELAMGRKQAAPAYGGHGGWSARKPVFALSGACVLLLLMIGAFAFSRSNSISSDTTRIAHMNTIPQANPTAPSDPHLKPLNPDTAVGSLVSGQQNAVPRQSDKLGTLVQEKYTDPTSLEADRLASITIQNKLREKHQASAAAADRLAESDTGTQQGGIHSPTIASKTQPARIALSVVDVHAARQQIQAWAATVGATVTVVTGKQSAGDVRANGPSSEAAQPAATKPENLALTQAVLLQLRVPVQHTEGFKSTLSQMGTRLAFETGSKIKNKGAVSLISPARPTAFIAIDEAAPALNVKMAHKAEQPTVTIYLRLQGR